MTRPLDAVRLDDGLPGPRLDEDAGRRDVVDVVAPALLASRTPVNEISQPSIRRPSALCALMPSRPVWWIRTPRTVIPLCGP
jgi:hypothetical protein